MKTKSQERRAKSGRPPRACLFALLSSLLALLFAHSACAQVLQGQWVDDANAQIEKIRKSGLRVIVVDGAGKPVRDAEVEIAQTSHAFHWGVKLNPDWIKDGTLVLNQDAPVYRCFNGVSLDALTAWPKAEANPGEWNPGPIRKIVGELKRRGLAVRWGPVLSNDPGRLPDWVVKLDPAAMAGACRTHAERVGAEFGQDLDALDVVGCAVGQDVFTEKIGAPIYGRLYESVRAKAPRARLGIYFADGLSGQRTRTVIRTTTDLRDQFIPIDEVALESRFSGTLVQAPVARSLKWIADAGVEAQLVNMEVAGDSPTAAALNIETVLITAFASPGVKGIWFAGVRGESFTDPQAALVDVEGNPTQAGKVFDQLVNTAWRTHATAKTDALGNAKFRAFAGAYRATARFPDGTMAETVFWLPVGEKDRIVLIQPLRTEGKP